MQIFPAIDIIGGQVVRLTRGNYGDVKKYSLTPLAATEEFISLGARNLHIVDLDGAKSGNADNAATIEAICSRYDIFIEVGGGIRSEEQIKKYLGCGVGRVILGTVALKQPQFLKQMIEKYGGKIAVGVDANGGKVATDGWEKVSSVDSVQFCKYLQDMGVKHVIYTDISKDGCLAGTNLDIYKVLCQTLSLNITASGGITYIDEITELKNMGVCAAIIGKAYYEGKIDLAKAIEAAR